MKYARSVVWWVWTFKLANMQISWTPKQHWTQFSVRLLATQSVSKFSCQVLIRNKLYIARIFNTCIIIYIHIIHIHTHRACYVPSQVAKNPSAWWVICGVFSSPGCNVLDRRFKSCGRCYNMSSSKARSGRYFFRRSGWARWIYWDEPKRIWVCYFCWDVCGGGLVERNGLLRAEAIWKQIANSREKGTSSGRGPSTAMCSL